MPGSSDEVPGSPKRSSSAPPNPHSSVPPGYQAPPLVGSVISDRYRVLGLIAKGGVSSVYLGQHVHMLKHVAIKVLEPQAADSPDLVARFRREGIAGAHLDHPHIVAATDFGQLDDGSYFLVMEHVPGVTLDRLMAERGALPPERAVKIMRQLVSALGAAHAVGVIHRDVKPTNVMLVEGGDDVVTLIDFGFARLRLSEVPSIAAHSESVVIEQTSTAAGVVLGTVAYMAPEAALGMNEVDHRSDLYAAGLIFYQLLAGRHPFDAVDPVQLFLQQRTMAPPKMADLPRASGAAGAVPPKLEAIAMRLLAKDPRERPQSAAELLALLDDAVANGEGRGASVPRAGKGSTGRDSARAGARAPWTVRARLFALGLAPKDGLFPAWAYFGLPLLAVVVTGVLALLFARSHSRPVPISIDPVLSSETAAFAEPAPAPAREVALEVGGLDGAGWRMNLRNAAREKDWSKGVGAVRALARLDAAALRERDAQTSIRNIAVGLSQDGGDLYDSFFDWLAGEAGQDGLDVLFDIARFRPATKAGKRAVDILRRPEIVTNASPALKVLIDFREASCVAQQDLFARMAQQGDDRALLELTILRDGECSRRRDPCCYKENRALSAAIRALRGRLTPAYPAASTSSPPTLAAPPALPGSAWVDAPR